MTVEPTLTGGVRFGDTVTLSAFAGGIFNSTDEVTLPLGLLGAQSTSEAALIGSPIDRTAMTYGANLRVVGSETWSVDAGYRAEDGETLRSDSARINLSVRF